VTLVEGLERIDFALRAHWDSHSTRLRVALPLAFGGEGVYGVPYGRLVRPEYEGNYEDWTGANGDWPAVDWAGVEGTDVAVALLNRGLPSYCTETAPLGMKTLFLSLLRSPTDGTYLNEPEYYSMPEYLGMRDAGHHELEFALTAYGCRFSESSVVDDATVYNAGLMTLQGLALAPLDVPRLESSVARVSAVKPADEGTGLAVRVFEHRGRGGSARLALPTWCRAAVQTNLRELEARPLTIADRAVTLELRPFEITTVLLRP
jgi:alpha-mannosidase